MEETPMQSMPVATPAVTVRPLAAGDLDAVVAMDAAAQGRTRRAYVERRLRAAQREPALHAQFGAEAGGQLVGFMLARVLEGEFGRTQRALRLELLGVHAANRDAHVGRRLFEAITAWAARHGAHEVRSAASWRDHDIVAFFDALGFELAPEQIVHGKIDGAWLGERVEPRSRADEAGDDAAPREIDYARTEAEGGNDHERAAHDVADVRTMRRDDLDAIARIDRRITGADRREYIAARLGEAIEESGVRVSLTAHIDGQPAGYLMARADLGDFGRTEPVAVIDTIGVDPGYAQRGIGSALLSQLFVNLGALRIERVETVVPLSDLGLLGFLVKSGFTSGPRLSFVRRLD
jgi:predicted N-acetyltransferase YhbS